VFFSVINIRGSKNDPIFDISIFSNRKMNVVFYLEDQHFIFQYFVKAPGEKNERIIAFLHKINIIFLV